MRTITINFNAVSPSPIVGSFNLGKIGEHNASKLVITPPTDLSADARTNHYRVSFCTGKKTYLSESKTIASGSTSFECPIYYNLAQCPRMSIQVKAYDVEGEYIGMSEKLSGFYFEPSNPNDAVEVDGENPDIANEIVELDGRVDVAEAEVEELSERVDDLEGSSHSHSNKALLDSYNQTNEGIADAVSKKHSHDNSSTIDKLVEISEGYGLAYTGLEIYNLYSSGKRLYYRGQFINYCAKDNSYCYFRAYSDQLVMGYYTPATTTYKVALNGRNVQSQSQSRGVAAIEFNAHIDDYNRHTADIDYHVNATKQANWNAKYKMPTGGIPSSDMTEAVQTSLGKADTALQEHQSLSAYRTSAQQDVIDNETNTKLNLLAELTKGTAWSESLQNTDCYTRTVPKGSKACGINKIGGKTIVENQLVSTTNANTVSGTSSVSVSDAVSGSVVKSEFNGETVVWNQLINPANIPATTTINGVTFTNNGNGTITVNGTATQTTQFLLGGSSRIPFPSGHKAMICGNPSGASSSTYDMLVTHSESLYVGSGTSFIANSDMYINIIVNPNVTVNNLVYKPMLVDLTMLSDSLVTDYTSFKSRYPLDYYAFDSGTLANNNSKWTTNVWNQICQYKETFTYNGVTMTNCNDHISVTGTVEVEPPYHQFKVSENFTIKRDGTKYLLYFTGNEGYKLGFNGYPAQSNPFIFSVNTGTDWLTAVYLYISLDETLNLQNLKINVINLTALFGKGNEPSTVAEFKAIAQQWGKNIDEYQPYDVGTAMGGTIDLTNLGLKGAGTSYDTFDAQSGLATRRIGVVDLGTLNYVRLQVGSNYIFYTNITDGKRVTDGQSANVVCANYTTIATQTSASSFVANGNKIISTNQGGITVMRIVVRDDTYTDAAAFKAAMSGVMLYYEKITPTTETLTSQPLTLQNGTNNLYQTAGLFPTKVDLTYYGTNYSIPLNTSHKYAFSDNGTESLLTSQSTVSVVGTEDKLVDLTKMYTTNEPTLAEFNAQYPLWKTKACDSGTLKSMPCEKVVSYDTSQEVIEEFPIPQSLRTFLADKGYGDSTMEAYNYLQFGAEETHYDETSGTNKTSNMWFVANVERLDLGTINWNYSSGGIGVKDGRFVPRDNNYLPKAISTDIDVIKYSDCQNSDKCFFVFNSLTSNRGYIKNTECPNKASLMAWASGKIVYNALLQPKYYDISSYLTTNDIDIESQGTLTLVNTNGDNYKIPIPNEELFLVNNYEATN